MPDLERNVKMQISDRKYNNKVNHKAFSCKFFVASLFFTDKVTSVRQATSTFECRLVRCPCTFRCVWVGLSLIAHWGGTTQPTSCPMDIVLARVLREVFDAVGPGLLVFIHTCLTSGIVPAAFKHAVVRPRLKKNSSGFCILSHFRPVYHLPFLSFLWWAFFKLLFKHYKYIKSRDILHLFMNI